MASIITADTGVVSGTAGLKQSADSSGVLALATGTGTTAVTIDASQNVGIGTSSPATFGKLAVVGGSVVCGNSPNGENELIKGVFTTGLYPAGVYTFNSFSSNFANWLTFKVTNSVGTTSEAARIDSSGSLQVGTTTVNSARLSVFGGTGSLTSGIAVQNGGGSGNYFIQFFNSSGSGVGSISQNGASATAFNTSSDYRLKENISPMTGALSIVQQLKPCTYTWKADGSNGQGFIAHELAEIVPDAVTGEKDAVNADGSIKSQGIDTSFLVATLTAAIQEQQALITTLTERISALEAK